MTDVYSFQELQTLLTPVFKQHGIKRAYLFGSYARDEATAQSDVDIKIESGKIKSLFGLGALYEDLVAILKKSIDLVTTDALEHKANQSHTQHFRSNIANDERLLYEDESLKDGESYA